MVDHKVDLSCFEAGLPLRAEGCKFDLATRKWGRDFKTTGKNANLVFTGLFQVEFAPTSMSKCRACGETIEKGSLRICYPIEDERGVMPAWFHCNDCVAGLGNACNLEKSVLGYKGLKPSDQALVKKLNDPRVVEEIDTTVVPRVFPPRAPPDTVVAKMLPFQQEGLHWLVEQEQSELKGGVLADEMGMGKTLQMISLMCARKLGSPTLVVCPVAAVHQWHQEIVKFTKQGTLSVTIFHGASSQSEAELRQFDVVITTYQTLEARYRMQVNKVKVKCQYCNRLFLPDKLAIHQRYFCGPEAEKTAKQAQQKKKDRAAATKGLKSMGLDAPPTITNIWKEHMAEAGVDTTGATYWNVGRKGVNAWQSSTKRAASEAPTDTKRAKVETPNGAKAVSTKKESPRAKMKAAKEAPETPKKAAAKAAAKATPQKTSPRAKAAAAKAAPGGKKASPRAKARPSRGLCLSRGSQALPWGAAVSWRGKLDFGRCVLGCMETDFLPPNLHSTQFFKILQDWHTSAPQRPQHSRKST
jgi:DNA repair protein RAD16